MSKQDTASEECQKLVAVVDGAPAAAPTRRVVVAVDDSDDSIHALTWALDNLLLVDFNILILLHVETPIQAFIVPAGPGFYVSPEVMEALTRYKKEISKTVLLRAKTLCDERQIKTESMVCVGDAREIICETVKKLHADILVMGSHGYGGFKRIILGSVSDYCAHEAECPVVIVKRT